LLRIELAACISGLADRIARTAPVPPIAQRIPLVVPIVRRIPLVLPIAQQLHSIEVQVLKR